jgi:hypothetical protein
MIGLTGTLVAGRASRWVMPNGPGPRVAVLKSAWNALRPGDDVLLHVPGVDELVSAVVVIVDTRHIGNGVGVRVTGDDGVTAMRWPPMKYVHHDPVRHDDACPRCPPDTVTAVAPMRLVVPWDDPTEAP